MYLFPQEEKCPKKPNGVGCGVGCGAEKKKIFYRKREKYAHTPYNLSSVEYLDIPTVLIFE